MRNVGLGQLLVLLLLCFLLFGDFTRIKEKFLELNNSVKNRLSRNSRKKGS